MILWGKASVAVAAVFVLVFGFLSPAQAQTGAGTVTQTLEDLQDQIDDLADDIDDDDGGNTQEQSQAQTQNVNLGGGHGHGHGRGGGGGSKLPKTGVDAAEVGGIGTASLFAGVSLMEFARRRRRNWIAPPSATVVTPAPRLGSSEGDLLLPYFPDQR